MDERLTPHILYRQLGSDDEERRAAYRRLFRTELDAEAVDDIRKALQLGMPLSSERFAEAVCTRLGIRHNSGRRGRPVTPAEMTSKPTQAATGQGDFGF